ncbi:MAG: VapC toxin family PIN domain ribonuclease, partial [Bifidobacteriaceae bacterium]|nr:VapC toxin family PIN domain ribonuclease [Bifidobacteriaceae bacterium]
MFLFDSSAAIALFASNHADHQSVEDWAAGQTALAMCPVSEGALVRYLVRSGVSASLARSTIAQIYDQPGWKFVADDVSYGQADLGAVSGHRQVTD